ncbi:MAG: type II toxin-antitoxin system RelE/ParE family toxin [Xanthobacteraceae bacterium]|nr:type II toxin-antitoxin system RelE/ParE family toxin [Xanthobacteraceae bacterium]
MIKTFKHKGLQELWNAGKTRKIDAKLQNRVKQRLNALEQAEAPEDMNIPGFDFHSLRGFKPPRFTVHVNGPWCITFEFEGIHAYRVDFEQYH